MSNPQPKQCVGVRTPTASSQCWEPPWAIFDTHRGGRPDRFACDAHLHLAIDRERGALVLSVRNEGF
jgi:hypothetical protein